MSAKVNTDDGIELQEQPVHTAAGLAPGPAPGPALTERFIDIDDVVDVEKGASSGADANGVSPRRTPSSQEEAAEAAEAAEAPAKSKSKSKKPAFLAVFNRESRSATIIFALIVVTAMSIAAVVALAIGSSKGNQEIKELQKALGTAATGVAHLAIVATMTAAASLIELRNDGYLQGVSGVLGDTSNLVQHAREVISTDACDGEATSFTMSTAVFNLTLSSTAGTFANLNGSVMPMATSVKGSPQVSTIAVSATVPIESEKPVVTPWLTMSNMMPESSIHVATPFMTESTSVTASHAAKLTESAMMPEVSPASMSIGIPLMESTSMVEANTSASLFFSPSTTVSTLTSTNITEMSSSTSTSINTMPSQSCGEVGDGAGPCARPYGSPNTTPASVLSVQSDKIATATPGTTNLASACPAPSTVPVTSSPMPARPTGNYTFVLGGKPTVFGSGTILLHVTKTTMSTATEPTRWGNGTQVVATSNGSIALPSNVTSTASATSATSTAAALVNGGEQRIPKPLGASGSGSGVYCTVMLVALLALLL